MAELYRKASGETMGNEVISIKRQQTAQRIIDAIRESSGLLTLAAKKANLTYKTIWQYSQDFPSVKQAVVESKERMLDFAEGKLYEKIKEGDNTAIIFYLKTQGKGRGYIERSEFTGANGSPLVNVNVNSDQTKDNLENVISRLSVN